MTAKEAFDKIRHYSPFEKENDIIESALNQLEEYQKCIDLEHAKYISTHNMSVMDTETYDLLHERSKQLEELEKENKKLKASNKVYKWNHEQELIYIAELRKVLNLIKEKEVEIFVLKATKRVDDYNKLSGSQYMITETEFELLKEYLKDE